MKTNLSAAKIALASALLTALTGCTTYVVQPSPQPAPTVYTPPPEPAPAPVYVEPAPPPAPAPAVVVIQSDDDFYAPLSQYGEWVVVDGFGRCWRPFGVETGWRPYASGHWELTDDGWYWESDEPWAWATYHYGRWELSPDYGWIWVPDVQWAPAWVTWREGGGYIGWAPLPPEPRPGITIDVTIRPAAFCFVEESHMHDPVRPTTVIVNNVTIINKTVNITKTKIVNNVVINEGPRVDVLERASGRPIQRVALRELRQKDEEPVAERHPNLRISPQRRPEPKQATPPQNVRNNERENPPANRVAQPIARPETTEENRNNRKRRQQPQANPVNQSATQNEAERRREQARPEPAPAEVRQSAPRPERQPAENQENREPRQREQNPRPAPREARPAERPQTPQESREGQPRPEETRPQQPERERPAARPQTQRNQPGTENERNAQKGRRRENTGTNNIDNERGQR